MADVQSVRGRLAQVTQSSRTVMRCLNGGRDSQESSQRAIALLTDILDIHYRVRDQISWGEEKWHVDPARLESLQELLAWFESTMKSIELYFQPGGVGVCFFRRNLLDRTYIPRLEQFKVLFLLSMQADSRERSFLDEEIRECLRACREVDSAWKEPKVDRKFEEKILGLTSQLCSEQFIALADLCNRRLQGTCQWIFDDSQYRRWLLGSFKTLYFAGPPGAGKTFLASTVIDRLQRTFTTPDVATVYIFCQDEKPKDQTSVDILRNILAQLVYRKRNLSYTTAALYLSESSSKGRASPKAYQNAIRAEVNRFSKVYLIIDGLDAFSEKERIISRLQKLPEQAQLLITLREVTQVGNASYVNVLAAPEDLHLYTFARIQLDPDMKELLSNGSGPMLQKQVIRTVMEKSFGVFLLAKIHMDLLARYTDRSLLERALVHLPVSLSEAYGEAMKQVVSASPTAARYVYWTLYAFRPMTVAELKHATKGFATEIDGQVETFEQSLQTQTAGILTVDAATGTVRFVHKTAKEYLNGTAARVFFPTAQKDIAEVCLTAITPDEVVDECYQNSATGPRNTSGGFLNYAATYWGYHARAVSEDEQTIQVLIKTFLNKLLWRRPPIQVDIDGQTIPAELGLGKYPPSWSAIHFLAFFGIVSKSKRLLVQGADINAHDNTLKITPLHCAAYRGNDEMAEFLLDKGADGNAVARNGNTALHLATQFGQRKVMKLLLARRVNSQIANQDGATGLQIAVGTESDEATVPLLVKNKVDVNVRNIKTGNTALHLAVECRRPRIILFLLDRGATIDMTNEDGLTPLQLAAKTNNCEAISLLLQRCAKVEARSLSGFTALQLAVHEGHWVAFDLLLIGGSNINAWSKHGETLLHEQAKKPTGIPIAFKLLEQGANIEARNSQGNTPLQVAALEGNKDMVMFLFSRGAKLDVETAKGESLLHITPPVDEDYLEILSLCLHYELDVNAVSSQGWTPLHQVVYIGTGALDLSYDKTEDYVRFLVGQGADINARAASATAETPLHLAAMAVVPRASLITLLVSLGAEINALTTDGKSALHLAAERGRESIFRVLLEEGADLSLEAPDSAMTDDEPSSSRVGSTALDLARKNPLGSLWFDDDGELRPASSRSRRDSVGSIDSLRTDIEDLNHDGSDNDTGGSTLVGSEQPYVIV